MRPPKSKRRRICRARRLLLWKEDSRAARAALREARRLCYAPGPRQFNWRTEQIYLFTAVHNVGEKGMDLNESFAYVLNHVRLYSGRPEKEARLVKYGPRAVADMLKRGEEQQRLVKHEGRWYSIMKGAAPLPFEKKERVSVDPHTHTHEGGVPRPRIHKSDRLKYSWCGPVAVTVMSGCSYDEAERPMINLKTRDPERIKRIEQVGIGGTNYITVIESASRNGVKYLGRSETGMRTRPVPDVSACQYGEPDFFRSRRYHCTLTEFMKRHRDYLCQYPGVFLLIEISKHWVVLNQDRVFDVLNPVGSKIKASRYSRRPVYHYYLFANSKFGSTPDQEDAKLHLAASSGY